jgi:hypothetical protein
MPRLSIELSERTKALAEARASQSGHASVDEYLEELIRSDASHDMRALADLMVDDDGASTERLVQLLDEAEASPESEMSNEDWAELCRRVSARGRGRARPGA